MLALNEIFVKASEIVARLIEVAAVFSISCGAVLAAYHVILSLVNRGGLLDRRKIWLGFASWLLLGLEFGLAADIIRSVLAPTWQDIGQLGAIAAIRTFLSYFLGKDIADTQSEIS